MPLELSRRRLFGGLGLVLAAPAIVRAASLMPVRAIPVEPWFHFSLEPGAINALHPDTIAWLSEVQDRMLRHLVCPPLLLAPARAAGFDVIPSQRLPTF